MKDTFNPEIIPALENINKTNFNRLNKNFKLEVVKDVFYDLIKSWDFECEAYEDEAELDFEDFVYISWENEDYKIEAQYDWDDNWDGNEVWSISVITFKKQNFEVYVKFEWIYSSWDNSEWDNMEVVKTKKVSKIEYS